MCKYFDYVDNNRTFVFFDFYSMNAMRSVFSSIWFAILPIPNKGKEKVDWSYQLIVNLLGSSIGGILAVIATGYIKSIM